MISAQYFEFALIFIISLFLLWFLFKNKRRVEVQKFLFPLFYFVMYRTRLGLNLMDVLSKKFSGFQRAFFSFGFVFSFFGMFLVCFLFIFASVNIFLVKEAPGAMIVAPINVKGVFYVPLLYWLLSIFVIAGVHEFAHGLVSRLYDIKVKSSGFAFLGVLLPIVPAAFVEPDEGALLKKSLKAKLSVFSAGPFVNFVTGLFFLLMFLFVLRPLISYFFFNDLSAFVQSVQDNNGSLSADVVFRNINFVLDGAYSIGFKFVFWLYGLFYWLFLLSLGIGLFNLLPVGPVDGGRMLHAVLDKYFSHKACERVFGFITIFFVVLLVFHIVIGFV